MQCLETQGLLIGKGFNKDMKKIIAIVLGLAAVSFSSGLYAQTIDQMDSQVNQSMGQYSPMNLDYIGMSALGMTQKAWLDPLQHMGEGQTKPAYSKYYWKPDLVLPIRVRRGMITLINFPEWELIEEVYIGDYATFDGKIVAPNAVLLYPKTGAHVGVDTNLMVFGRSGNRYVFYLRSEGINTDKLTHSVIDIEILPESGGVPKDVLAKAKGSKGGSVSSGFGSMARSPLDPVSSTNIRKNMQDTWLQEIPVDPEKFRFDLEIYVPNPEDAEIAPERVWRDEIFTYIDLGKKSLTMIQRPIVNLLVQGSEVPVGFRTKGPHGRLIVVEAVGDMVMRNGARIVCIKMRKDPARGTEMVEYGNKISGWDAPAANALPSMGRAQQRVENQNNPNNNGAYIGGYNQAIDYYSSMQRAGGIPAGGASRGGQSASGYYNPSRVPYNSSAVRSEASSSFSIELGTDVKVETLERNWKSLLASHSDILKGFEPYFSVDAAADGSGRELYHLRVGPVQNLRQGDAMCGKLGRRGVFCSVVRTQ
jgi:ComB9 competence protein